MSVRFWLANGLILGGMAWMMSFAGMEVRAAQVLPRQADHLQLDQLEARAAKDGITVEQAVGEFLSEKQPMLQFSTPEAIGGLAVFLCSDAARTITGVPVSIDGGWVAQ